jgi:hypothetical protein
MEITLLNVSYKSITRALALTTKHILLKIIQSKQTSFIGGHFILYNVCVVWEGMDWARCFNLNDLFITIDFKKAHVGDKWPFILPKVMRLRLIKTQNYDSTRAWLGLVLDLAFAANHLIK